MVPSLEVSRLCRDNAEWHHLRRIAAVAGTLIIDEQGIYGVSKINDWILLGLNRQLSEYELHGIRERMAGGQRSKVLRGELKPGLPIGLAYTDDNQVVMDPDQFIVEAIDLVFKTVRRLGSVRQVTRWSRHQDIRLPSSPPQQAARCSGAYPMTARSSACCKTPATPAVCYAHGRTSARTRPDGTVQHSKLPRDKWLVCTPEAHMGYIDWECKSGKPCAATQPTSLEEPNACRRRARERPFCSRASCAACVVTGCA